MNNVLSTVLASALLSMAVRSNAETPTNTELLAKVKQGNREAILDAGRSGDKSFVPVLEGMAKPHLDYQELPQAHPVYDSPTAKHARMALAKLGIKEYLDEILIEATNPTNSPVYKHLKRFPQYFQGKASRLEVQMDAFDKIRYIKDRSTVKVLASLLYAKENPADYSTGNDVIWDLPSNMAMYTLAQIVDNPPQTNLSQSSETHDARLKMWQQWWEQNKDKYP